MIELRGASKRFDRVEALHPTDLQIPDAGTTVLIGPSGCGKSTVLRLVNGLIQPTSGEVLVDSVPVTPDSASDLRKQMGYVIQEGGLFPHLTANGNVTLMARRLGWTPDRIQARIRELCALTRFPEDGLNRYPVELSGGQRQRVSLMRALMLEPKVLLLDEPLGALDPMVRSSLQTDLKEIFRRLRQTVVMVTHDLAEAAYLGDRIVVMNSGRVVQIGSIDDLRDRPADGFVSEFVTAQRSLVAL